MRASSPPQLAASDDDGVLPPAPLESRIQSSSWVATVAQLDDDDAPRGWVPPSAWVYPDDDTDPLRVRPGTGCCDAGGGWARAWGRARSTRGGPRNAR